MGSRVRGILTSAEIFFLTTNINMKSRLWCGTNYNLNFDYNEVYSQGDIRYLAYGDEICPTTKRPHHQFFVLFKTQRSSIKNVATLFGGVHVEPCKGSLSQNEVYCSKEGSYHEFGEKPKQGDRTDLHGCMAMVADGASELEIAQSAPRIWCQYGRRFEEYRALLQPDRDWETEVRVWWGKTNTGKSRSAREWLGEYDVITYTKGDFFIGYNNHENVLIEEMGDTNTMSRELFLQITDRYKHVVNVKGGERKWNPKRIAITSNYDPKKWFQKPDAVLRRISEIIYLDDSKVDGSEVASGNSDSEATDEEC